MGIFSKNKIYCVEWHSRYSIYRRDFIKAKDEADAWRKIKKQNPGISDFCDNIYEVIPSAPGELLRNS